MSQQRILIVLNDGNFQGASVANDAGDPQPLDLKALSLLVPKINAAAVEKTESLESELSGKILVLKQAVTLAERTQAVIKAIALDPAVNDQETTQAIIAILADSEKLEPQKRKDALTAEIAAKTAELAAIP